MPYPLNDGRPGGERPPFFILSTGRSGSTLLRAILMQHPTISIPPESYVLGRIIRRFERDYGRLPWRLCVRLVASEFASGVDFQFWNVPLETFIQEAETIQKENRNLAFLINQFYQFYASHHKPAAARWGDKSTSNALFSDALLRLYPQAQFIHIIRDGRDVVASRLARGWHDDIDLACDKWLELIGHTLNSAIRQNSSQFFEIHYEELVRQPDIVVPALSDFLGLPFLSEMLQPHKIADKLGDTDRVIHENLNKPISPAHIGKWRQTLSQSDQAVIQERLGPMLVTLGYEI